MHELIAWAAVITGMAKAGTAVLGFARAAAEMRKSRRCNGGTSRKRS